ncbi:MAG: cyclohydrolase [Bacteroidota bacterium]|jgi:GTP cyclohydrolase I
MIDQDLKNLNEPLVKNGNTHSYLDNGSWLDELGDSHQTTSIETPVNTENLNKSDAEKLTKIQYHFKEIMETLGMDLTDDSLKGTPGRVAKMFVKEIFSGLNPKNMPDISLFENKFGYKEILIEKNITVQSFCEHHFLPIIGKAHIAYKPGNKVIGLSKLNRIVDYYSRRPQVQERLTRQIAETLRQVLETDSVAVYIEAVHFCVQARGIEHQGCTTVTTDFGGDFKKEQGKHSFYQSIQTKI